MCEKGPFGCKCQDMAHHVVGDGCSECNPDMADQLSPITPTVLFCGEGLMILELKVTDHMRKVLGEWHDVGHPATDDEVLEWAMYVLQDDASTLVEDYNAHQLSKDLEE